MLGDIGIGILASLVVSHMGGFEATPVFIMLGIIFAVLPDIDTLVLVSPQFKKLFMIHRGWTHYPIIYIPCIFIIWIIGGPAIALLFALCVFLHFVHDTLWIGPGIMWGWPYSKKHYKFFNQEKPYTPGPITWFQDFYLKPTLVSVTEITIFILSLVSLYLYFR